jgi:methyl-accepting chemotaxis protein
MLFQNKKQIAAKDTKNEDIQKLLKKLNEKVDAIMNVYGQLQDSYVQTRNAAPQITQNLQEVSSEINSQLRQMEMSTRVIEEMAVGINKIAETSSAVSETSIDTAKQANLGNETIKKTMTQMNMINNTVLDSSQGIKNLDNRSKEIGQIVGLITNIANQTNLLALNAAIEAARAGEHGRGFAIVAGEVRKLAEQSANSANQISTLVQAIQKDTASSVENMNKVTLAVESGINVVREAGDAFQRILKSAESVADQIQDISAVSEEISAGAEEASANMVETSNYGRKLTDKTSLLVSTSSNQATTVDNAGAFMASFSRNARELKEIIEDLQKLQA